LLRISGETTSAGCDYPKCKYQEFVSQITDLRQFLQKILDFHTTTFHHGIRFLRQITFGLEKHALLFNRNNNYLKADTFRNSGSSERRHPSAFRQNFHSLI
jgi:hypothetical protein